MTVAGIEFLLIIQWLENSASRRYICGLTKPLPYLSTGSTVVRHDRCHQPHLALSWDFDGRGLGIAQVPSYLPTI